jgi:peptidoglycan/LPS O-acetylase OafA/YrhL
MATPGPGVPGFGEQLLKVAGTAGVAVFFVLSGFLLYRPFSAALRGTHGRPSVGHYFRRRAARILPAYWIAFAVSALWIGLDGVTRANAPIYAALLQDYTDATRYHGIAAAWSLSIEATFYILLPIGAAVLARLTRRLGAVEIPLLIAVGLVPLAVHYARPSTPETILTHLDWFALGMLLASLSTSSRAHLLDHALQRPRAILGVWTIAAAAYLVASQSTQIPAREYAFGLFAAALVASGATTRPGRVTRAALGTPALAWIGLVSYGVFLWHDPIVVRLSKEGVGGVALVLVSLGVVLAVAAASYYVAERPVQRWVRRRIAGRQ